MQPKTLRTLPIWDEISCIDSIFKSYEEIDAFESKMIILKVYQVIESFNVNTLRGLDKINSQLSIGQYIFQFDLCPMANLGHPHSFYIVENNMIINQFEADFPIRCFELHEIHN